MSDDITDEEFETNCFDIVEYLTTRALQLRSDGTPWQGVELALENHWRELTGRCLQRTLANPNTPYDVIECVDATTSLKPLIGFAMRFAHEGGFPR